MNVKNAILNDDMSDSIQMEQLEGFVDSEKSMLVREHWTFYRLKRT